MNTNADNHKLCENCTLASGVLVTADAKNYRKNSVGKTSGNIQVCESCIDHFSRRKKFSQDILIDADKRLIVAGPGTGKTFTFKEVIKNMPTGSSSLVFTLINNLAFELERDLCSIENRKVKVNTFHGYCKELLHSQIGLSDITKEFSYTPILPVLIEVDAQIMGLNFSVKTFRMAFADINEVDELKFYLNRASYYNSVSHIDSVYRVYKYFKDNPSKVIKYDIVIADEFQDFNKLESEFITILSNKNKILIAGDDDQALYHFRGAKKDFIRDLYNNNPDYQKKELPFCSRCTPVIVDSTNKVIEVAQKNNKLVGRIKRQFISYWPDKYREHLLHPNLYLVKCSKLSTVSKYIEARIIELTKNESISAGGNDLPFMVIGPESGYHLNSIKKYLDTALDKNIFQILDSRKENSDFEISEGYQLLNEGINKNLGWRIILHFDPVENIAEIIRTSYKTGESLEKLLPKEYIKKHIGIAKRESKTETSDKEDMSEPQKIKILLTNFLGSKGLSALHVAVVGLNNYIFPDNPNDIKDDDVCKFIVALTRAKNSCALISSREYRQNLGRSVYNPSVFLSWLPVERVNFKKYKVENNKLLEEK